MTRKQNAEDSPEAGLRAGVSRLRRDAVTISVVAAACVLAGASLVTLRGSAGAPDQSTQISQSKENTVDVNVNAAAGKPDKLPMPLRSVLGSSQWLNTAPLRPEDLHGKVVLVNFWTYSCINSLRPLPYLRAWAEKYKDRGLVVIGVHTPEFAFEHDAAKVQTANAGLPISYPVALDSDYAIWSAFDNQAWPAFYFFGADGRMRHKVFGENGYDQSERWIQKLLSEASGVTVTDALSNPVGEGAQAPPSWREIGSGETYVGFARGANFSSPGGVKRNLSRLYTEASVLQLNHWSLSGRWTVGGEYANLDSAPGRIAFRFHARDLHLVLGRASREAIRFRVTIDGEPPGADHGADTDAE
ncbi:MAG TPA: redoxin domain-containing protein, partial [Hyphomonadaceae bacterium]|nr:redoxin domain-containing protein [Hyphomonadaceae bacterium]